jgi:hypothetical protein
MEELRNRDIRTPVAIGGSVITTEDARKMRELGVAAVFGAGAREVEIIDTVRDLAKWRCPSRSRPGDGILNTFGQTMARFASGISENRVPLSVTNAARACIFNALATVF